MQQHCLYELDTSINWDHLRHTNIWTLTLFHTLLWCYVFVYKHICIRVGIYVSCVQMTCVFFVLTVMRKIWQLSWIWWHDILQFIQNLMSCGERKMELCETLFNFVEKKNNYDAQQIPLLLSRVFAEERYQLHRKVVVIWA